MNKVYFMNTLVSFFQIIMYVCIFFIIETASLLIVAYKQLVYKLSIYKLSPKRLQAYR